MTFNAVIKLIDDQLAANAGATAIIDAVTGEEISYLQLNELTNQFGNTLKKIGMTKGTRFVCMLPNVPEMAIAVLAGLKIGAVPVPCFSFYLERELEFVVQNSDAELIITYALGLPVAQGIKENCPKLKKIMSTQENPPEGVVPFWKTLRENSSTLACEATEKEDLAMIFYTSGTTGKPKALPHSHGNLIGQADAFVHFGMRKFGPGDVIFSPVPAGFSFGLCNLIPYPFRFGAASVFLSHRLGPEEIIKLINTYDVSQVILTATSLQDLINVKDARLDAGRVEFHTGASGVSKAVFEAWEKRFPGVEVLPAYGMQEIIGASHTCPPGEGRPDTIGKLINGWSAMILDNNGQEVKEGPGVLYLKGPSMINYYWKDPVLTEQRFLNGYLRTGDIVTCDQDGFYKFIGREDDIIKTAGWTVSPVEIETILQVHPVVKEVAVVGLEDAKRGQIVCAAIVPNNVFQPEEELIEELKSNLKQQLASYKIPRKFFVLEELPKTSTGKIKKSALQAQLTALS